MGPINTDHWLTMSECLNAWRESPKYIAQYWITELVPRYGVIPIPGASFLIEVCQQQLSQPLVRLFPIPEYLCNSLLFRIPYLIVRKLMSIILRFNEVFEVINCCDFLAMLAQILLQENYNPSFYHQGPCQGAYNCEDPHKMWPSIVPLAWLIHTFHRQFTFGRPTSHTIYVMLCGVNC